MSNHMKRIRQERALERRQAELERGRKPVTQEDNRINVESAEIDIRNLQDKLGVNQL